MRRITAPGFQYHFNVVQISGWRKVRFNMNKCISSIFSLIVIDQWAWSFYDSDLIKIKAIISTSFYLCHKMLKLNTFQFHGYTFSIFLFKIIFFNYVFTINLANQYDWIFP